MNREKAILERILALKQIIQDGAGGPLELHELGICYFHLGNHAQAADYLTRLFANHPDYIEIGAARELHAFVLLSAGLYDDARSIIAERLLADEQNVRLLAMDAFAEEKLGRMDEAIRIHRRILELAPDNVNSLNSLGYLLARRGDRKDFPEAFEALKRAVAQKPDHPAYLDSLGVLLAKVGNADSARKALTKALQRAPQNQEILDHLKELLGL